MIESVIDKWAILFGIDYYPIGDTPKLDTHGKRIQYSNLQGCVRDILGVKTFLSETMKIEKEHIFTLLAPVPEDDQISDYAFTGNEIPTYDRMITTLEKITKLAKPGDLVYIHYSGHGARATTIFPNLKDGTLWDEALVPTDIQSGGHYLRDLEMGLYLKKMVEKALLVTIVLDCCHSGGGVRSAGRGTPREVKGCYKSIEPDDRPQTFEEIERNKCLILREPEGFNLFAACLPEEKAKEYYFIDNQGGSRVHGVFTYHLLKTLNQGLSQTPSSQALYQRVFGKVRDDFVDQNPYFAGDASRFFFSADIMAQPHTLTVQRLPFNPYVDGKLRLSGGTCHGVHTGSEYAVYPFGRTNGSGAMKVEVIEATSFQSVAIILELNDVAIGKIEPGCPAILTKMPYRERSLVAFISPNATTAGTFAETWKNEASDDNWLELTPNTGDTHSQASFYVILNDGGEYEIQNQKGILIPNVTPPLQTLLATDPSAIPRLIRRLRHLAQFQAVQRIENMDGTSLLRGSLSLGVSKQRHEAPQPYAEVGAEYEVRREEEFFLHVKNHGTETVYLVILDLEPSYEISQAYPRKADFEPVEPGQSRIIPVHTEIHPQIRSISKKAPLDMLKIIVSSVPTSFRSLELDNIARAEQNGARSASGSQDEIQNLLGRLARVQWRKAVCKEVDIQDWQVMEVRIRTQL